MIVRFIWMRYMRSAIIWGLLFFSGLLVATGFAGESDAEVLRKGTRSVGISGGIALGTTVWGGFLRHDAAMVNLHFGSVVSDLLMEDHFLRGRFALGADFSFSHHYKPKRAYLIDAASNVRYIFETSERWKPFVDAGIGIAITDIGRPNLGGKQQFSPQAGAGIHWFYRPDLAVTFQERYMHFSNGGLRSPNSGVNQFVTLIGLTRFY